MLQSFRTFFGSKLGVGVTLGFLGLISLAFLGGDVASGLGFGSGSSGSKLASVGSARIEGSDLEIATKRQLEQMRSQYPQLDMKTLVAEGGADQLLNSLIDLAAVREFGRKHGIVIGDRLIDSEIAKIPGVQGVDGKFSEASYQMFLRQQGLSDKQLRDRIAGLLMERQLLSATQFGIGVPPSAVARYAGVVTERRAGTIAMLPAAVFAPKAAPTEADIQGWYAGHKGDYQRPERRVLRYVTFDGSVVQGAAAPTEAEIAARYKADQAKYAASETRKVSQLVVADEASARALAAQGLDAGARAKGLTIGSLGSVSQAALTAQTTSAAAEAVFAAAPGKVVGPVKAPLGWLLLRVDAVEGKAGKSLDQARPEIAAALALEKRRAALTDFSAKLEEEFADGATLADVAKELGLTLATTPALTADGGVYGQPGAKAPAVLDKVLQTAFMMEEQSQPQLAETDPGKAFVIFDVASVEAAAPPPLAEIRSLVAADLLLAKGAQAAKAAAEKVKALIERGTDPAAALAQLGVALPPVDRVDMARQQVQQLGQNAPPPVLLLFATAKGKTHLMAAPRNRGWYVVTVQGVTPGKVDPADPRLAQFGASFSQAFGGEYGAQLRTAMGREVGIKRNETAIKAVRARLVGAN